MGAGAEAGRWPSRRRHRQWERGDAHGQSLDGATQVAFNGVPASIDSDTATEIHTTVPAGATTGSITVTTPYGTATSTSAFTVT